MAPKLEAMLREYLPAEYAEDRIEAADLGRFVGDRPEGDDLWIDGNDVAAFMKDLQIDSSAMPGMAFDLTFEMPEKDVGVMTFNRCPAPAMFELLGRQDILAIPPRPDANHVCRRWKLSMRDESDPEFVQIEESTARKNED